MAVANYHEHFGCYPPPSVAGPDGRPWHSWRVLILPYLEHSTLYQAYDFDQPWDGPHNRKLAGRMPTVYAFPGSERPGSGVANYFAVVGPETAWPPAGTLRDDDVSDGTASTILVVESLAGVPWMSPSDLAFDRMDLRVNQPTGVSSPYQAPAVATLDGAVHQLLPQLSPVALRALLTTHGGEPLERDAAAGWKTIPDGRLRPRARPRGRRADPASAPPEGR